MEYYSQVDYAVAVMVYIVSIVGVLYSIYCMMRFSDDKKMTTFMGLTAIMFCGTTYIGGMMVQAFS